MGHIRLSTLKVTRCWKDVIGLVTEGAEAPRVAEAVTDAWEQAFNAVREKGRELMRSSTIQPGFVLPPPLSCGTAAKRRAVRLSAYVAAPQLQNMRCFCSYLGLAQQLQGVLS
jgi:hypothetical protein